MKKTRKYWYYTTTNECVLCGRGCTYKERRYGKKPKKWDKRNNFIQYACGSHFT